MCPVCGRVCGDDFVELSSDSSRVLPSSASSAHSQQTSPASADAGVATPPAEGGRSSSADSPPLASHDIAAPAGSDVARVAGADALGPSPCDSALPAVTSSSTTFSTAAEMQDRKRQKKEVQVGAAVSSDLHVPTGRPSLQNSPSGYPSGSSGQRPHFAVSHENTQNGTYYDVLKGSPHGPSPDKDTEICKKRKGEGNEDMMSNQQDFGEIFEKAPDISSHSWKCTALPPLIHLCASQNTILELSGTLQCEFEEKARFAAEVSLCCLGLNPKRMAVVIAPTVPIVRQYNELAQQLPELCAKLIIGNAKVDTWVRQDWQRELFDTKFLMTTPQLFQDALDARNLYLQNFCILVVDQCQHCCGSHPFAKIFSEHYHRISIPSRGDMASGCDIRVLALSENLVKRKVKSKTEQEKVVKKLEQHMHSRVHPAL